MIHLTIQALKDAGLWSELLEYEHVYIWTIELT